MNKKADLPTLVFVLMTLAVSITILFGFLSNSSKISGQIIDVKLIDTLDVKESIIKNNFETSFERALAQTYKEIIENQEYISAPVKINSEGYYEFKELDEGLDKKFLDLLKINFRQDYINCFFNENYLQNLKHVIFKNNNFSLEKKQEVFYLKLDKFNFSLNTRNYNITYFPELSFEKSLNEIGLHGFDEIYNYKQKCSNLESVSSRRICYQSNDGDVDKYFNVKISELSNSAGKYILISLESKREFLINGKFEKIKIEFIPV
ncbi:hypothetical protein K9L16_00490 [Candidatus Pacearchaeota archaeon]|nr:hypothetical protein [Candidatus Pacearchaeota archaeon]